MDKRVKELEAEMEFYKAGKSSKAAGKTREAPAQLTADLERTTSEKAALAKSIADNQRKLLQVRSATTRQEAWVELKQMHREGKLDLRDPKEVGPPGRSIPRSSRSRSTTSTSSEQLRRCAAQPSFFFRNASPGQG